MSLFYNENSTDEMQSVQRIQDAIRNRNTQTQIIREATHQLSLANADYVRQVQSLKTRYDAMSNTFSGAELYLRSTGSVFYILNQKELEKHFEVLQDDFRADFFNGDNRFELINLYRMGCSTYAWTAEFKFEDKVLKIQIPVRDNLTVENIDEADGGQFQFAIKTSKKKWKILASDYLIQPIAEVIKKHFELD